MEAKSRVESPCSTRDQPLKLERRDVWEDSGITGVGVKSADNRRNNSGEGDYLAHN